MDDTDLGDSDPRTSQSLGERTAKHRAQGVTTNQTWVFTGIDQIVQSEQGEYILDKHSPKTSFITHDNASIPFRVYEPAGVTLIAGCW